MPPGQGDTTTKQEEMHMCGCCEPVWPREKKIEQVRVDKAAEEARIREPEPRREPEPVATR